MIREISAQQITAAVKRLCITANKELPPCVQQALRQAQTQERSSLGKSVLSDLCKNMDAARQLDVPVCQDTGMAVVFLELGQDLHIIGGDLESAVNQGVREGYLEGYLRLSIVRDPIRRGNTNDNTPAVIHTRIVPGDRLRIMVAPKGFGSENMSSIRMFNPSVPVEEILAYITDCVRTADSNPCPPVIVGVGIGGDFEFCAYLAKKALCRDISIRNPDPYYAGLEETLLKQINALQIGPQGFGGDTTALAVNIEQYPTHIAGLPVAVNMGCHVTRHAEETL